jgi:hypothetical protein
MTHGIQRGGTMVELILCSSERPGMDGDVYHLPYIEAVEGYRHGCMTRNGVRWTRNMNHTEDIHCPECASERKAKKP